MTQTAVNKSGFGVHRSVIRSHKYMLYCGVQRTALRAASEKLDADTQLGSVEPSSSVEKTNILAFWKSPRRDVAIATQTRAQELPVLARLFIALFRFLPYAVRAQFGAFRFLEPRAKRKQPAGKNTLISRHRLEHLLDMGIRPSRLPTYQQALTHPSAVVDRTESFERLELLGDGVLTLVAREFLLERLPTANEGMITIQTSALVSNECISSVAQWLGIGKYVRGHCIDVDNSRGILCDSFEALVGAIYTDKGLEGARGFITRVLKACPFAELETLRLERNYVAELKYMVRNKQSEAFRRPLQMTRSIVSKKHKNKKRTALPRTRYRVEIIDERTKELVGAGESYTIVIAEQLAAKEVVAHLDGTSRVLNEEWKSLHNS